MEAMKESILAKLESLKKDLQKPRVMSFHDYEMCELLLQEIAEALRNVTIKDENVCAV